MIRNFSPTSVPTPENYAEWYAWRKERTAAAMAASKRISGQSIRLNNLSMKMLYDNGYTLNPETLEMVKA